MLAAGSTMVDAAWILVAMIGGLVITQAIGWSGTRPVAIVQSLTPWLAVIPLACLAIGVARSAWMLTTVSALVLFGIAIVVVPAMRRSSAPAPDPGQPSLRVFHGNLWYENVAGAGATAERILSTGADVLAMSEFTDVHERALLERGAAEVYPHRCGSRAEHAEGMVMWSRRPLHAVEAVPMDRRKGVVATTCLGDQPIRIVLAHPEPPVRLRGLRHWASSMRAINAVGSSAGPPTMVVGDLNSARWHPPFRALLHAGWRDAHERVGHGLSVSWPTHRRIPGPFIRLDHCLVGPGLDAVRVDDIDLPGSDHRGFVVTVTLPTGSATAAQRPTNQAIT